MYRASLLKGHFLEYAAASYAAREGGLIAQQDLADKRLDQTAHHLTSLGPNGVAILRELTTHKEPHVRLFAACYFAKINREHALRVLTELANSRGTTNLTYHNDPQLPDDLVAVKKKDIIGKEARLWLGWIRLGFCGLTGV